MRISNYILIAFFFLVTGSIFLLFIFSKAHKDQANERNGKLKTKEFVIQYFTTVVVEEHASVFIKENQSNRLEIAYLKEETEPENPYYLSNDTLFITSNRFYKTLYCSRLTVLIAKNKSDVKVQSFRFGKVDVQADHAVIQITSDQIDSLSVNLTNNSHFTYRGNPNNISISKDPDSRFYFYYEP
jgi:hypothetical protein